MRKTKNKTSFRVDFESLMTNMAIFSTSVALLPNKITEKTVKTVILSLLYNTTNVPILFKTTRKTFSYIFELLTSKHFNKSQLCDVITVIFMISYAALSRLYFSRNVLQFDILCSSAYDNVWDCKPTFSVYVFASIWPTKITKMTVKIKICVKRKRKHRFVLILSR